MTIISTKTPGTSRIEAKAHQPGDRRLGGHIAKPYEARLDADLEWALSEGGRHFDETNLVHVTLRDIAEQLSKLGISYAVAGGLALFAHGFRRFTEDVDILISEDNLVAIHAALSGRGYLPLFAGSKNLRNTTTGVRVEFLIAGQFPGDGKPKPVVFPPPETVNIQKNGRSFLALEALIELKLASGISASHRGKDFRDVQDVITTLNLPREFGNQLNLYVQSKFYELWDVSHPDGKRYVLRWPLPLDVDSINDIHELKNVFPQAAAEISVMQAEGVTFWKSADSYAYLITSNPSIADKYEMHEESQFTGLPIEGA